jgi:hypothetical protein
MGWAQIGKAILEAIAGSIAKMIVEEMNKKEPSNVSETNVSEGHGA